MSTKITSDYLSYEIITSQFTKKILVNNVLPKKHIALFFYFIREIKEEDWFLYFHKKELERIFAEFGISDINLAIAEEKVSVDNSFAYSRYNILNTFWGSFFQDLIRTEELKNMLSTLREPNQKEPYLSSLILTRYSIENSFVNYPVQTNKNSIIFLYYYPSTYFSNWEQKKSFKKDMICFPDINELFMIESNSMLIMESSYLNNYLIINSKPKNAKGFCIVGEVCI